MPMKEVHAFEKQEKAVSARALRNSSFSRLRYVPRLQRNHYLAQVPGEA
jgi:hypothetical protein